MKYALYSTELDMFLFDIGGYYRFYTLGGMDNSKILIINIVIYNALVSYAGNGNFRKANTSGVEDRIRELNNWFNVINPSPEYLKNLVAVPFDREYSVETKTFNYGFDFVNSMRIG
jgi:hypothetical protein